jgi:mono/diheme cytochrome c family protein
VTLRTLRLPALALALAALAGCPRLDPMQRQAKVKAYQASDFYQDGLGMRAPPEGTVPYGAALDPTVETGRGPDGKPVAVSPVPVDPALLARGRAKFDVSCAVCHGLVGDGDSQVALNMSLRRPPSLHLYRDRPDGYLYQVISQGFGLMPSYAHSLSVQDRWAVVAYLRALQLSQHAPVDQLPDDARARLPKETP